MDDSTARSTQAVTKATASYIFEGDIRERAICRDNLNTRLALNHRYQSADFDSWLHRRLDVGKGEHILDVGCGTGAQSLRFLKCVGARGSVSALDISAPSVAQLRENANDDPRLVAVSADMADLAEVIESKFRHKVYTLAHSSYALYYSREWQNVLGAMASSMMTAGRVAVFTPTTPNGLVDIAGRYSVVPSPVLESLEFGQEALEPEMRRMFWDVTVHFFQSDMRVTSLEDFMKFYQATTYFDAAAEPAIQSFAESEIRSQGAVVYAKNGYLIIGRDRR